ncbi:Glutathione ABC transporter permease OS=Bosea thiooxidans OX=53254 GN=ARD30_12060 PE=3 SV=1 [Bosea thiooxidans]
MLIATATLAPSFASLGYVPFGEDPLGNLQRLLLPAIALALPILANLSRLVRTAMLDALGQDYIRTARAKGLGERAVLYRHALRNALIPFVTSVGIMTGYLLGGAIVVEQVFSIPGLGRLILGAIAERNYPLVQATILVVTVGFVLVNALVDFAYALIDPRLRTAS